MGGLAVNQRRLGIIADWVGGRTGVVSKRTLDGRTGAEAGSRPTFLETSSKELLGADVAAGRRGYKAGYPKFVHSRARDATDPAELRAAGFGGSVVLRGGVGGFRVEAALDYGLAFLEVRLGCDGVVDLGVG